MDLLTLKQVSRTFGEVQAVSNLSFSVAEHSVFGFLGKNGAGKTTTLRMIAGLLAPSSGAISVAGQPVVFGKPLAGCPVGYLPDVPSFYGYMTPMEYLRFCGRIAGMEKAQTESRGRELLNLTGLEGANRRIKGFSRGMKQRLGIAQALLSKPRLLLCDEPTSALDPVGRKELLDILRQAAQYTTVMLSTHILSDVERICDAIGVIDSGRLTLMGSYEDIRRQRRGDEIVLEVAHGAQALAECIRAELAGVSANAQGERIHVVYQNEDTPGRLLTLLARENVPLLRYELAEPALESLFLEAVT